MRKDRRSDMTELILRFRYFAKGPMSERIIKRLDVLCTLNVCFTWYCLLCTSTKLRKQILASSCLSFICLSVCLSICPSVCPSIRLSVHLSVCPSVCLSVRMEQLGSYWKDFHEIWYFSLFFLEICWENAIFIIIWQEKWYFKWSPIHISDHISPNSSYNEKCFGNKF